MPTPPISEAQEKILHNLYYVDLFMFGRDKIFKHPKIEAAGISRRQVAEWLSKQEVHQIFSPARAPRDVQPTVAHAPYSQLEVDLMDMSTLADDGYHWILTAIDLYTKRAWAQPLKDKTSKEAAIGMLAILSTMKEPPMSIRSDNGSEFINSEFEDVLKESKIKHVFGAAGKPQSNGAIERFNGILKRMIKMNYFKTGQNKWVAKLPKFIHSYNNSYQRIIKMTPMQAESLIDHSVVGNRILKNVTDSRPLDKQKFNIGDEVRIRLDGDAKKGGTGENYSKDIYIVNKIFAPQVEHRAFQYSVEGLPNKYFNSDLLIVHEVANKVDLPDTYTVSRIERPSTSKGAAGYIVYWTGYKESSWEPRTALMTDIPKMIEKFDKDHSVVWTEKGGKWAFRWRT